MFAFSFSSLKARVGYLIRALINKMTSEHKGQVEIILVAFISSIKCEYLLQQQVLEVVNTAEDRPEMHP